MLIIVLKKHSPREMNIMAKQQNYDKPVRWLLVLLLFHNHQFLHVSISASFPDRIHCGRMHGSNWPARESKRTTTPHHLGGEEDKFSPNVHRMCAPKRVRVAVCTTYGASRLHSRHSGRIRKWNHFNKWSFDGDGR